MPLSVVLLADTSLSAACCKCCVCYLLHVFVRRVQPGPGPRVATKNTKKNTDFLRLTVFQTSGSHCRVGWLELNCVAGIRLGLLRITAKLQGVLAHFFDVFECSRVTPRLPGHLVIMKLCGLFYRLICFDNDSVPM